MRTTSYVEKCMISRVKNGKEWSWKGVKYLFKIIFKGVVQARESIACPKTVNDESVNYNWSITHRLQRTDFRNMLDVESSKFGVWLIEDGAEWKS